MEKLIALLTLFLAMPLQARETKAVKRENTLNLRHALATIEQTPQCQAGPLDEKAWKKIKHGFDKFNVYYGRIKHKLPKKDQQTVDERLGKLAQFIKSNNQASTCALAHEIKSVLLTKFKVAVAPNQVPALSTGKEIFQRDCVSCHGTGGRGDGPLTKNPSFPMKPSPTDFLAPEAVGASPFRYYNVLLTGVEGTVMGKYDDLLTDHELWSVAFYLISLRHEGQNPSKPPALDHWNLAELSKLSDWEILAMPAFQKAYPDPKQREQALAWLRRTALQTTEIKRFSR